MVLQNTQEFKILFLQFISASFYYYMGMTDNLDAKEPRPINKGFPAHGTPHSMENRLRLSRAATHYNQRNLVEKLLTL